MLQRESLQPERRIVDADIPTLWCSLSSLCLAARSPCSIIVSMQEWRHTKRTEGTTFHVPHCILIIRLAWFLKTKTGFASFFLPAGKVKIVCPEAPVTTTLTSQELSAVGAEKRDYIWSLHELNWTEHEYLVVAWLEVSKNVLYWHV